MRSSSCRAGGGALSSAGVFRRSLRNGRARAGLRSGNRRRGPIPCGARGGAFHRRGDPGALVQESVGCPSFRWNRAHKGFRALVGKRVKVRRTRGYVLQSGVVEMVAPVTQRSCIEGRCRMRATSSFDGDCCRCCLAIVLCRRWTGLGFCPLPSRIKAGLKCTEGAASVSFGARVVAVEADPERFPLGAGQGFAV